MRKEGRWTAPDERMSAAEATMEDEKLVEKSRIEGSPLFWCLTLTLVSVTICLFRQFVEWL